MPILRAIAVLWIRQVKRHLRSKFRIIGSLGQPALFLVALGFGLGPVYARAGGGSYLAFLAPGVIAMAILFSAMFAGIEVIWDRRFGFLKEMLVAPVPRLGLMLGRTLGGATIATMQGVLVTILAFLVGFRPASIGGVLAAIPVMFLVAVCFTAFGTTIAARMEDMQAFPLIMNFILMPLFFLSGALFPLDTAPAALRVVARVNPLTYGVDALRGTFSGVTHLGIGVDLLVLLAITIIFLAIGSALFRGLEA